MKDNAEYKEGIKTVIELLQMFHDGLDIAGEPQALCSYCGAAFESIPLVKEHVLTCKDNPFVAEIERLQRENGDLERRVNAHDALVAACEKCEEWISNTYGLVAWKEHFAEMESALDLAKGVK